MSDDPPDMVFEVRVVKHLPDLPHSNLIFDSCHGLWKLYAAESGYLLESSDTVTCDPRGLALISRDLSKIDVWICEQLPRCGGRHMGWAPMHIINPVVEVCLVTKLARDGGLLLHSAGVLTEHGAWVFAGGSGAGKSTLSDLFAARGRRVLSDERMILRKVAGELVAYGTPWAGIGRQATNAAGSLTALYCIRHGEGAHALRKMSPRDFSLFVLQQCFLPHWDRQAMDSTLGFFDELVQRVDCFDLAFVNDPDIVDYLEEQRLGRLVGSS
jgi:hypothetical protein